MEPQDKILHTALELFFRFGIKRVTMDDIAKELGMSKKTIYQFYSEKDDLVNKLSEVQVKYHETQFTDIAIEAKDPIHEIILITQVMRKMMQNMNPIFFMDLQKFYPQAYKTFQTFKEQCAYKNIIDNIKKGIEIGIYRADIDVEFVARYRLAQMDMLMFGNYFTFEKISFTQANELILDMFVRSISTLKGHKLINKYNKIKDEE
jgi:TetR/AcrR family transcriptional regulator, cholesterol catabolism regulator